MTTSGPPTVTCCLATRRTPRRAARSCFRPVTFRLMVEDVTVEPVDPLFLTPGCRLYLPPNEKEPKNGGAWCTYEGLVPVKYYIEAGTGSKKLSLLKDENALHVARLDPKVLRGVGRSRSALPDSPTDSCWARNSTARPTAASDLRSG